MPTINNVPTRSMYPTAPGYTLGGWSAVSSMRLVGNGSVPGGAAVSANGGGVGGPGGQAPGPVGTASPAGGTGATAFSGNPVLAFVGIVVLVALAWIVAHKTGNASEFSNIRLSALNIFLIAAIAIVGIVSLKFVATKWTIPGVSQVILAT